MCNYQDKQTPISEMENSLNEEVVSKIMSCNELSEDEQKELNEWLNNVLDKYGRDYEPF